jgi:hypothetical protein
MLKAKVYEKAEKPGEKPKAKYHRCFDCARAGNTSAFSL